MNYQYRYGSSTTVAVKTLWWDGGFGRYYQGLTAALFQGKLNLPIVRLEVTFDLGPIARFGDTAANAGIFALLQSNSYLKDLPSPVKTIFASLWYAPPPPPPPPPTTSVLAPPCVVASIGVCLIWSGLVRSDFATQARPPSG